MGKKYQNRTQHPISQADHVLIENNNILKIKKNLKKENSNQSLAEFLGIMKCSKNGANELINIFLDLNETHIGKFQNAPSFKKAYLTDILQELINRQVRVSPIFIQGNWLEIDTPQDLDNAKKIFLD